MRMTLMGTVYQDFVFEVETEELDDFGNQSIARFKRKDSLGKKVIKETDPLTGKFLHPHEFAGMSPWKTNK
jgi:hypothetical protein